MVAADALAIGIGALLGTRLPERAIKVFAAVAFVVFGALLLAEGLGVVVATARPQPSPGRARWNWWRWGRVELPVQNPSPGTSYERVR